MKIENICETLKTSYLNYGKINRYFFSRKDYAKNLIEMLMDSNNSISLFEIRRKGKTTFLIDDIAPLASDVMYVFYFSFMKNESDKNYLVLNFKKTLFEFIYLNIMGEKIDYLKDKKILLKKLGFKLPFLNIELSNEFEQIDFSKVSLSDLFLLMDGYAKIPVLFLFDEFQELAKMNQIGFVRDLRTELDIRKNYISCIFTGSSYNALDKMFSQYNQPFFKFGINIDFPDLGMDFIENCEKVFYEKTKIHLDKIHLFELFNKHGKYPMVLIDALLKLEITRKVEDVESYIIDNSLIKEITVNQSLWKNFSEIDKRILFLIVNNNNNKISSEKNLKWLSKEIGQEIKKNNVTYSLRKLKNEQVIYKSLEHKNEWFLIDNSLKRFIQDYIYY